MLIEWMTHKDGPFVVQPPITIFVISPEVLHVEKALFTAPYINVFIGFNYLKRMEALLCLHRLYDQFLQTLQAIETEII